MYGFSGPKSFWDFRETGGLRYVYRVIKIARLLTPVYFVFFCLTKGIYIGYNLSHIEQARMDNFVLLHSLDSKSLEVRNTSEKREKIPAKWKKLDEDALFCNTWWSDIRRLITKTFLTFSLTSKRQN